MDDIHSLSLRIKKMKKIRIKKNPMDSWCSGLIWRIDAKESGERKGGL